MALLGTIITDDRVLCHWWRIVSHRQVPFYFYFIFIAVASFFFAVLVCCILCAAASLAFASRIANPPSILLDMAPRRPRNQQATGETGLQPLSFFDLFVTPLVLRNCSE